MSEEFFLTEKGAKTLEHKRNVFYQTPGIKEWFYKENEVMLKNLNSDSVVLDVGCGLGTHIKLMNEYCKEIIGIDHSDAVLKRCISEVKHLQNVKVFKMNIRKLDFPDNCFDQTTCMFNTLGNTNNEAIFLSEMKRVTKPSGRIIFSLYKEKSIPERLEFYKKTGMTHVVQDGTVIKSNGRYYSKTHTEESIKQMCKEAGLDVAIYSTNIGFVCEAKKKK